MEEHNGGRSSPPSGNESAVLPQSIGVDDSSNYWLGSDSGNAPLLDVGGPGFEPRSGLSLLFLQVGDGHS